MSRNRSRRAALLLVVATAGLVAACGTGGNYAATPLPGAGTPSASASPSPSSSTPAPECTGDPTASYGPGGASVAELRRTPAVQRILAKKTLTVGVSADTRQLGANNPETNTIEGFDIDVARAVTKALFGELAEPTLKVITTADRIPALQDGSVDLVARTFTINCARWGQIAFSGTYYEATQQVLVPTGSKATTITELPKDSRVCAPTGSTSLAKLADYPTLVPVAAATHTACLVLFQQGQADAITGDDTVLAGLAAQDPYTKVLDEEAAGQPRISQEPYGLGMSATDNTDFVRFVNAVLDEYRASGQWQADYDQWLAPLLGPATPPTPVYGRTGPTG